MSRKCLAFCVWRFATACRQAGLAFSVFGLAFIVGGLWSVVCGPSSVVGGLSCISSCRKFFNLTCAMINHCADRKI